MVRIESTLARMRDIPLSTTNIVKLVTMATALWFTDFLILICCFGAVHATIPWSGVLLAFGVAQIVASLPLIPGASELSKAVWPSSSSPTEPTGRPRWRSSSSTDFSRSGWSSPPDGSPSE
jgi:hypothetical protein